MHNPIYTACQHFLSQEFIQSNPRIQTLFKCALRGLDKLKETYASCSAICLGLNYFTILIDAHIEQTFTQRLFFKDDMTILYTNDAIANLNMKWTDDKIKIILDLVGFLNNDSMAADNVKTIETIMNNIDIETARELLKPI